jgi:hypothetical protein
MADPRTNLPHRIVRWLWEKLTGEDPFVVSLSNDRLERLNGVHCDWLQKLEREHPELEEEINRHHMEDRLNALHPPTKH